MKLSRFLFILSLVLFARVFSAQTSTYDSLWSIVDSDKSLNEKEDALWALSDVILDESPEKTPELTDSLLSLESVKSDSALYIKALKIRALGNRKIGNYVQSIGEHKIIYDYALKHNDTLSRARAADQIGIMNTFMGNMQVAQKYLLEVHELYTALNRPIDIADANNGLAIFYSDMNRDEEAIERYNLAMSQYNELDDTMGQANISANLGLLYMNRGEYEKAEKYLLKQGKLDSLLGTQWGLGFHFDFMGLLRQKQGRLDEAYENFQQALTIRKNLESHYNIAESHASLAGLLLEKKEYNRAIFHAEEILKFEEKHQSLSQMISAYKYLSEAHEAKADFKTALEYQKKYKIYSDSIYNRDHIEEITTKDALFQKVEQDNKIALLDATNIANEKIIKQKNRTIIVGTIGFLAVCLLLFFLYRLYQKVISQKAQLSKTLAEKDVLLREIHHRVKNNLQLVSSLLNLQSRSIEDKAALKALNDGKSRVRSMALIHQDLYNRENLTGIHVKSYLENLTSELFQTYAINPYEIELEMDIADIDLDVDTVVPLGLIINELITNSLKYAFDEGDEGILEVSLQEVDEQLKVMVKDSGKGYDPTKINPKSFGNKLITILSKQLKAEREIIINNGTQVILTINKFKKT